jgi:hypothetical protein
MGTTSQSRKHDLQPVCGKEPLHSPRDRVKRCYAMPALPRRASEHAPNSILTKLPERLRSYAELGWGMRAKRAMARGYVLRTPRLTGDTTGNNGSGEVVYCSHSISPQTDDGMEHVGCTGATASSRITMEQRAKPTLLRILKPRLFPLDLPR